jgi:predicted unusual protein kinase regulating ubiquinone biosynthesis (AarF/ABC1/UbiB family)
MVKQGGHMAEGPRFEGDGIAMGRVRRTVPLLRLAARTTGESVIDSLRRRKPDPEAYATRADRYVEVLGHSKGALMKVGQMLSVIPSGSSVPPQNRAAFQAAMGRLQADAPPMATELAAEVIRSELGQGPERAFAEFSPMPFAAASIGQVHAARLHNGRAVAVKVQYPGVAQAIRSDLRNGELVAVFLQLVRSVVPGISRIDNKAVAAEISERITEEVDYRLEASNQSFFADSYRGHPFIHIPEVIPEVSTARVLTQELVEGLTWSDALSSDQSLRNSWGEVIYRFAHESEQRLGTFNTDPHPGNYIFHLDGSVTFLDFGCVKRFDAEMVTRNRGLYQASLHQDAEAFWRGFVDVGAIDPVKGPSPNEMADFYRVRDEMHLSPQPFTWVPEMMSRIMEHEYSVNGPSKKVIRALDMPRELVFFFRFDLGVLSVMSELRSTVAMRDIMTEIFDGGPPGSPLGEAESEFWSLKARTR